MSVAALVAILGTGAQAFDTNATGDILSRDMTPGNYTDGVKAESTLLRSGIDLIADRLKGDSLIYPAFNMKDAWGTEVVFRNNLKKEAVIAKVVVYAADDSREIVDFNVYLSAKDQFRMTMKNGMITSTDGSTPTATNAAGAIFASETNPFSVPVNDPVTGEPVESGYVIVYGMAQTDLENGYHGKHNELFKAYRAALSEERPGWDSLRMHQGVYADEEAIQAPNMHNSRGTWNPTDDEDLDVDYQLYTVAMNALSGTERIFNGTGETRDMLLNPTALLNFTDDSDDGQIILWAPGEYATLADRNIKNDGAYDRDAVNQDNNTFLVASSTYAYENAGSNLSTSVDNKLLVLQPMKRLLAQLGFGEEYWVNVCIDESTDAKAGLVTGMTYGFRANLAIWNENENALGELEGSDPITSPDSSQSTSAHCMELEELNNLEAEAAEREPEQFADKNGFVNLYMSTGKGAIPAIITQMTASRVAGDAHINWVYTPSNKILDALADNTRQK